MAFRPIAIYDNVTLDRLAFLENAYNVGYEMKLNAVWTATFTLPINDPKNKFCQPFRFVEIYDEYSYNGANRPLLFRIMPIQQIKTADTREIVYQCEHVIATLIDDVLVGWHEIGNVGVNTAAVISYVLSQQTVKRWNLQSCAVSRQFLYGWENENLLAALFSVINPFPTSVTFGSNVYQQGYTWEFDTSDINHWNLSLNMVIDPLRRPDDQNYLKLQYGANMTGITKKIDPSQMATRILPLGAGEGINQLNIAKLNNGNMWLEDAGAIANYGAINRIWIDQRYQDAQSLYDAAAAMLLELREPYVSYEVDSIIVDWAVRYTRLGDFVRVIDDEDSTDFWTRIIAIKKDDVLGNPRAAKITIANKSQDIATSLADLADRQRINAVYSQGAVTVYTMSFADNASCDRPAVIKFPIPDNIVHINGLQLNVNAEPFRSYAATTEAGGGVSSTTAAGGGEYTSSSAEELEAINVMAVDDDDDFPDAVHNHGIPAGTRIAEVNSRSEIIDWWTWVPSGAHYHEAHSHSIDIDPHKHKIDIEPHTHDMKPGIFEGDTAEAFTVQVDGNDVLDEYGNIKQFGAQFDVTITDELTKNSGGDIVRGWHEIRVIPVVTDAKNNPQALTRVNASVMVQLFANSRGGGQY